jgi:hypothetical protein
MAVAKARTFSSGKFQGKGEAAAAAGLSGAHLSRAIRVLEQTPDLVDDVLAGEISLNDAYTAACFRRRRLGQSATPSPRTLAEYEAIIERGLEGIAEAGALLLDLRDREGYRDFEYDDFDSFLRAHASGPFAEIAMKVALEHGVWPREAKEATAE